MKDFKITANQTTYNPLSGDSQSFVTGLLGVGKIVHFYREAFNLQSVNYPIPKPDSTVSLK